MTMEQSNLDRRDVLAALFPDPDRYLLVAGLAGAARDTAAYTSEADNLIALGGAMGGAVPMALGMALSAPGDEVAVITGDGELLMNIGALASVASMMPANLSIVCIDNGRHMETGGDGLPASVIRSIIVVSRHSWASSKPRRRWSAR